MDQVRLKTFIVVSCLLALVGCRTTHQRPDAFSQVQDMVLERTGHRMALSSDERRLPQEGTESKTLHEELTLSEAVHWTVLNNPSINDMLEELNIAGADLDQAGLWHNPWVSVGARFPDRGPAGTNLQFAVVQDFLDVLMVPLRKRLANLSMDNHPMHLHGFAFEVTGTDGGPIPKTARWPMTTVDVPPGSTRDIEWVADEPGDWPFHCHKTHHTMIGMEHGLPNMLNVDQGPALEAVHKVLPDYMPMGQAGMSGMHHTVSIPNYIGMGHMEGPWGSIEMGGMFTLVRVRNGLTDYQDPGWYPHPTDTVAAPVGASAVPTQTPSVPYTCPMHPEVVQVGRGRCPKCGMDLIPQKPITKK